jgi:hypothetical protein
MNGTGLSASVFRLITNSEHKYCCPCIARAVMTYASGATVSLVSVKYGLGQSNSGCFCHYTIATVILTVYQSFSLISKISKSVLSTDVKVGSTVKHIILQQGVSDPSLHQYHCAVPHTQGIIDRQLSLVYSSVNVYAYITTKRCR